MSRRTLLLLNVLLQGLGIILACVHDQIPGLKLSTAVQNYSYSRRGINTQPIRIVFDLRFLSQEWRSSQLQSTLNYAALRLSEAIKVQPVQGKLYVARNCTSSWLKGSYAGMCASVSDINRCGTIQIPSEHLGALEVRDSTQAYQSYPAADGVSNADLLIYVTVQTTAVCSGSTLAYSSACRLDQYDRPLVGFINFCPNVIDLSNPNSADYAQKVTLHEMIHILGFSSRLFAFFRDEAGTPRTPRCPSAPGCSSSDHAGYPPYDPDAGTFTASLSTLATLYIGGRPVRFLATPSVALVSRAYFGCASAAGAALESTGGGEGLSANSHWEMRHLFTELMTPAPDKSFPILLTEFTLAVLADSGSWTPPSPSTASPTQRSEAAF
jgi:leishmanolysin-like peptidase